MPNELWNPVAAAVEAAALYLPGEEPSFTTGRGGMNNTTRFVQAGGNRYVLRFYETHGDEDKVRYEHEVLQALEGGRGLSFQIPMPLKSIHGDTLVRVSGKLAAMFRFLEGDNPVFDHSRVIYEFGRAAGELSGRLARLKMDLPSVYPPYYSLEMSFPDAESFCREAPAPFDTQGESLERLVGAMDAYRKHGQGIRSLPHQLIHGDMNASNCLVNGEGQGISAILDFEFATMDLRAMELAVCMWDLIRPGLPTETVLERMKLLVQGFEEWIPLSQEERSALPILVQLRSLDVFVHFLGRYRDGVDESSVLTRIIGDADYKIRWVNDYLMPKEA